MWEKLKMWLFEGEITSKEVELSARDMNGIADYFVNFREQDREFLCGDEVGLKSRLDGSAIVFKVRRCMNCEVCLAWFTKGSSNPLAVFDMQKRIRGEK